MQLLFSHAHSVISDDKDELVALPPGADADLTASGFVAQAVIEAVFYQGLQ